MTLNVALPLRQAEKRLVVRQRLLRKKAFLLKKKKNELSSLQREVLNLEKEVQNENAKLDVYVKEIQKEHERRIHSSLGSSKPKKKK